MYDIFIMVKVKQNQIYDISIAINKTKTRGYIIYLSQ